MVEPDKATLRAVAEQARADFKAACARVGAPKHEFPCVSADLYALAQSSLDSAIERLREIAALKGSSKRQRVNSELAISWLLAHGYALEEGGYVPGKGFENTQESKS